MAATTNTVPEPGHEADLSCGLAENPCPDDRDEDYGPFDEPSEVNDYDRFPEG